MDGFKAYRYYMAIKLHFTTDKFNVFENRGNIRGTREAFNARNDRYIFEKLARRFGDDKSIVQYFVSNFAYNSENSIYSGAEADENYTKWQRIKQSISKTFIDDLVVILNLYEKERASKEQVFKFSDWQSKSEEYPLVLRLFIGSKINIETIAILHELTDIVTDWENNDSVKYIWDNEFRRIKKLTGFVKYDKIKLEKVLNHFIEELD